jgi:hypothetical protein
MASSSDGEEDRKLADERAKMDLPSHFGDGKRYDKSPFIRRSTSHQSSDRHRDIDADGDVPVTKYDMMTSEELEEERQRVKSGLNQV